MAPDAPTEAARYARTARAAETASPATEALRLRYAAYRLRQGRDLLTLLPREGVRSLVRLARSEDTRAEPSFEDLARLAADLLPLPPFGAWLEDFHRHRAEHLAIAEPPVSAGPVTPAGESVTLEVRGFRTGNEEWVASLVVHEVPEGWRGAVHFHRPPETRSVRTADIFREADVTAVRDRFRAFDEATLGAFLRSSLP